MNKYKIKEEDSIHPDDDVSTDKKLPESLLIMESGRRRSIISTPIRASIEISLSN